ncbi:hypothetical protein P7K49_012549 [Saguinus oedipus]|uniref:Uncharacterized protein n=1 Tax=Saguinus oedipus TaxID=9490 RepID=A0ABQ9VTW2_SAGOE|nr:hypothetical protein P7K49_012549 [Saguinus oedipus]
MTHSKSSLVAGPALPPNYKSSSSDSSDSDEDSSSLYEEGNQESEDDDTGPTARKQRKNQDDDEDDDDGFFGPALPPGFKKQDDSPPRSFVNQDKRLLNGQDGNPDFLTDSTVFPAARMPVCGALIEHGPALPPGFIKAAQKSDKGRDDPEQQYL